MNDPVATRQSIITLTTDFGPDSPYVAEMKGVIYSIHPHVTLVDGTHAVTPQDILQGSFLWKQISKPFPAGTIHLAVVDPDACCWWKQQTSTGLHLTMGFSARS